MEGQPSLSDDLAARALGEADIRLAQVEYALLDAQARAGAYARDVAAVRKRLRALAAAPEEPEA